MTSRELLAVAALAAPLVALALVALAPRRLVTRVAVAAAVAAGALALALAAVALVQSDDPSIGKWIVIDAAGGLLIAVVGARRPRERARLARVSRHRSPGRPVRTYFVLLYAFWAVLLAVPLAGNLGAAWLLVEATTAPSALLVGFSGKARALEAGWKYLILTSLGLGVALLGIVFLAAGVPGGLGALSWARARHVRLGQRDGARRLPAAARRSRREDRLGAGPQLAAGRALRGAGAGLGAALGGAAAERAARRLALRAGARPGDRRAARAQDVLIAFGLVSLAVAVPFLWRSLAWKRLLAYSSLEHMGVIALGIGFASPLALAGVAVHIAGHAIAKALGFYAATPLLGHEPRAAGPRRHRHRPHAARRSARRWASRSARSPGCRRRRSSSARC